MTVIGVVAGENPQIGRYALQTEDGYSIADLLGGTLCMHEVVEGTLWDHGLAYLINRSTGETVEVVIEAVHANRASASALLFRK